MVTNLLAENVTSTVITPYLQLKLLPRHASDWDLVTNNNWIKVDNATLELEEEISVVRQAMDNVDQKLVFIESTVQDEAIARSQGDAVRPRFSRFSNRPMTTGSSTLFTHNLGRFPQVSVIREIGASQGVDVTNAFDTLVTHASLNQISVTIGISGTYTIICVA